MHREEFVALAVLRCCAILVVPAMAALVFYLIMGASGLFTVDHVSLLEFLTSSRFDPDAHAAGALPFILGSLAVTGFALAIGGPLGVSVAIFLAEIAPRPVAGALQFAIELLVGVPSVVYGWLGLMIVVPALRGLSHTPGFGICAAGIVLVAMILPTIVALSLDALRALPRTFVESSLALGATRWETIWHAMLPAARPAIGVALILGVARAIGETLAVEMVIGNAGVIPRDLFHAAAALPTEIVIDMAGAPSGSFLQHALFAMACLLLFISMLLVLLVRWIARSRK
jgi:phosphate transport system permease protein